LLHKPEFTPRRAGQAVRRMVKSARCLKSARASRGRKTAACRQHRAIRHTGNPDPTQTESKIAVRRVCIATQTRRRQYQKSAAPRVCTATQTGRRQNQKNLLRFPRRNADPQRPVFAPQRRPDADRIKNLLHPIAPQPRPDPDRIKIIRARTKWANAFIVRGLMGF
jgi:hypothetical protein